MHDLVQAKYEGLETVGRRFRESSSSIRQMRSTVRRAFEKLNADGWTGRGAAAFSAEMTREVLPALERLEQALQESHRVVMQLSAIYQMAEQEAAALFGVQNAATGAESFSWSTPDEGADGGAPPVPMEPVTPDKPDLDAAFDNFEVPFPDSNETVVVPPQWLADLFGLQQRTITAAEGALLDEIGLLGQYNLYQIQQEAFDVSAAWSQNQGLEDGPGDAFRHAYWTALMTREFGEDWARRFSDAHEALPPPGNVKTKAFMDLWNNNIGIEIAAQNPNASKEELAILIGEAMKSGRMVVIDPVTQRPIYSDQIPEVADFTVPPIDGY
jgi:WXG100 family type VII secretion target